MISERAKPGIAVLTDHSLTSLPTCGGIGAQVCDRLRSYRNKIRDGNMSREWRTCASRSRAIHLALTGPNRAKGFDSERGKPTAATNGREYTPHRTTRGHCRIGTFLGTVDCHSRRPNLKHLKDLRLMGSSRVRAMAPTVGAGQPRNSSIVTRREVYVKLNVSIQMKKQPQKTTPRMRDPGQCLPRPLMNGFTARA